MTLDPFEVDLLCGYANCTRFIFPSAIPILPDILPRALFLTLPMYDLVFQQVPVRAEGRIWVNGVIPHPIGERFDHALIIGYCTNSAVW